MRVKMSCFHDPIFKDVVGFPPHRSTNLHHHVTTAAQKEQIKDWLWSAIFHGHHSLQVDGWIVSCLQICAA